MNIQAGQLKQDDTFLFEDRLYRVEFEGDSFGNELQVVCIGSKMDGRWVKPKNVQNENFNPYCSVQQVQEKDLDPDDV